MGLLDRIKKAVVGEIEVEKKNDAFDQIQSMTGVPIDEKQRAAIMKANVDPNLLVAGFTIKRIKDAAGGGRAGEVLNQLQQPGGLEQVQEQFQTGANISQGGVSVQIPSSAKAEMKAGEEKKKESIKAERASMGTTRFLQQYNRSYEELKKFDPEIDTIGFGGIIRRTAGKIGEKLGELPETTAFLADVKATAQQMASELEGGRVTNQDRDVQADRLANALKFPTQTNIRLMANSYIRLLDKAGTDSDAITDQLKKLASTKSDIFDGAIEQILVEYPELAPKIYGEGFEVQKDEDKSKVKK